MNKWSKEKDWEVITEQDIIPHRKNPKTMAVYIAVVLLPQENIYHLKHF